MKPAEGTPYDWKLKLVWALAPGGLDQPGTIWCGTLPGGLFRSDDSGQSWQLNRPLWDNPLREEWFGGGADYPGIHSICVDPRPGKSNHVFGFATVRASARSRHRMVHSRHLRTKNAFPSPAKSW